MKTNTILWTKNHKTCMQMVPSIWNCKFLMMGTKSLVLEILRAMRVI